MESIDNGVILQHPPEILEVVRKSFNMEKPGVMTEAIDILEEWIKQQEHFIKKDFCRSYLERCIVRSKGSVERAKERMEKLCTARTLLPKFFVNIDVRTLNLHMMQDLILPKLTKDYNRVYLIRNWITQFEDDYYMQYYTRMVYFLEYFSAYDYSNGLILIADFTHLNVMESMKVLDIKRLGDAFSLGLNSYGLRIKAAHIISPSKLTSMVVAVFKQVVSEKIGNRIKVHADYKTILDFVDRDVLPKEYDGNEVMSFAELHEKWLDTLSTKDFQDYMKEMNNAKTDETRRLSKTVNSDEIGISGTFRKLRVD